MKNCYNPEHRKWDRFKAFHHEVGSNHNVVIFDTGELILTNAQTNVDYRRAYHEAGIELTATIDLKNSLYAPDGREIKRAWFVQTQYLLIDHSSKRVVCTEGRTYNTTAGEPLIRQGIPDRFTRLAQAYIGGEGQLPIGTDTITTHQPHKFVASEADVERFDMLISTFRAVAKLDDSVNVGQPCNNRIGMPFDTAMKCQTWQDVPVSHYGALFHSGIARPIVKFDYLLTEAP